VGGTLCTSAAALQRFFTALSAAPEPVTAERHNDHEEEGIEKQLAEVGI
jgi:hypothetical protein